MCLEKEFCLKGITYLLRKDEQFDIQLTQAKGNLFSSFKWYWISRNMAQLTRNTVLQRRHSLPAISTKN